MPRIAGSDRFYRLGLVDKQNQLRSRVQQLTSVTTILEAVPKRLQNWGWRLGVEATVDYLARYEMDAENGLDYPLQHDLETFQKILEEGGFQHPKLALDAAADRGTNVHSIAEAFYRGNHFCDKDCEGFEERHAEFWNRKRGYGERKAPMKALQALLATPDHQGYIDALLDHDQRHIPEGAKILLIEEPLFCTCDGCRMPDIESPGIAGTTDLVYQVGGHYYPLDFKSSKAVWDSHLIQSCGYGHLAQSLMVIPPGISSKNVHPTVCAVHPDGTFDRVGCGFEKGLKYFRIVQSAYSMGKVFEKELWMQRKLAEERKASS